jgi:hypothetical protein
MRGGEVRQAIKPVTCFKCGTANQLSSTNTSIAHFISRPDFDHLVFTCRGCSRPVRYWASGEELSLARRAGWHIRQNYAPDDELIAARAANFPPRYRLNPRHEQDLALFRTELDRLEPDEVIARMEGGQQYRPSNLPLVWPCNCGGPGCAPVPEAPGAPLESI